MKALKLAGAIAAVAMVSGMVAWGIGATPKILTVAKLPGSPTGPLTIVYFRADPPFIQRGQASVLKWKVTGATTVTLYGEDNSLCERQFGRVAPEDSLMVCPEETTAYVLTAQAPNGEMMQSVTVHVAGVSLKVPSAVR